MEKLQVSSMSVENHEENGRGKVNKEFETDGI